MSRKIFKNREPVPTAPFQFQGGMGDGPDVDPLSADAELDAFEDNVDSAPPPRNTRRHHQGEDAEAVIAQAQADADAIVSDAQNRAAGIEREAYEKGLEEGRKTGEIMADQQLQAILHRYHQSLTALDRVRALMLDQMQLDLVDLVIDAAEKVVKTELQQHPRALLAMVKDAIRSLKERKNLTLYLNSEDHQFVQSISDAEKQTWLGSQVVIEVDPQLASGDFRIETPGGELDGLVRTQLLQIHEELSQALGS